MVVPQVTEIEEIIDSIYVLPAASKSKLLRFITEIRYPKGHILLKADAVEKSIYFIKTGIVRAYSPTSDNHELTFWFGKEGQTIISMKSYIENQKSYENVELLEDCELYHLNSEHLNHLFEEDIFIANWGRKFAEQELIQTEERLIQRQFKTATERYKNLLSDNPDFIRRIQLGHIASYLGITQVSLSRIRAEIKL